MYSFDIVGNKTQTFVWQHKTFKTLNYIKLRNTNRELINRNICNNVLETEMLYYKREIAIVLNIFLRVLGKTTYEWHTDDIRVHTSDIGMTYEWHTDHKRVHTSDIGMTCEYIRVAYGWHTRTYEWHTNDKQVHTRYIPVTYT